MKRETAGKPFQADAGLKILIPPLPRPACRLCVHLLILLLGFVPLAGAGVVYDIGQLDFSASGQSIWGAGTGITPTTTTASAGWSSSSTFGGITGGERAELTPAIPSRQLTPYIPAVYGPDWYEARVWVPFVGYRGCGCWKSGPLISPAMDATYSPAIPATYGDTRTGAEITLSTSGSVGMISSLGFNGGSVDANLKYQTRLEIPDRLEANRFFSLDGKATLDDGSFSTVFPKLTGNLEVNFDTRLDYAGRNCLAGLGCSDDATTLLDIDSGDMQILELNTPDLPDKASLFGLDVAAFDITRMRVFADLGPEGVKISLPGKSPPGAGINLAMLDLDLPDLTTGSELRDGRLLSSNTFDNIIRLDIDLDAIAGMLGVIPPGGLVLSSHKLTFRGDLYDIDLGPTIDLSQEFQLEPALMIDLEFSEPVQVRYGDGSVGTVTRWSGAADALPEFALTYPGQQVVVTPTYRVEAQFSNRTLLDFDLTAAVDILKGEIGLSIFTSPEFCLLCSDFPIPLDSVSVFDQSFALDGFEPITAEPFLLSTDYTAMNLFNRSLSENGPRNRSVPEPGLLPLLLSGLLLVGLFRRGSRRTHPSGPTRGDDLGTLP